jgi:succinate-semialdehyde dehydrogenase/glutarate-semialdehyde dehydrogenase
MEALPDILIPKAFIGGEWRDAKKHFSVTNPANGKVLAEIPDLGREETLEAVAAAEAAWPNWKRRTAKERANLLRAWFEAIMAHQEDLARLMTMEQGKPIAESRGEVAYGASFVEFYAEEAKRMAGETLQSHGVDKRILVFRESIGVVAAVTPWNFPLAMITRKCAPALAAGCTVLIKPAEATPLTALAVPAKCSPLNTVAYSPT